MKLVRPISIDDTAFVSSNVAEDTHAVYNAASTYAVGDMVYYVATNIHGVYQSLQAANTGHTPSSSPTWWQFVSNDNRWAMLDNGVSTATSNANSIDLVVKPNGRVESVGLINVSAASARLKITDATDGLVYDQTVSLISTSGITDMYAYFSEPIVRIADYLFTGLGLYYAPTVELILTDTGNTVSCGGAIYGQSKDIGATQYGASVGIQDYSIKQADTFGNYNIVQRTFSKKGTFTVFVPNTFIDQLEVLLETYRALPVLYSGSDSYASTLILGFYKDFSIVISYPDYSVLSIQIEGLT
jgi:hypothetical protein